MEVSKQLLKFLAALVLIFLLSYTVGHVITRQNEWWVVSALIAACAVLTTVNVRRRLKR